MPVCPECGTVNGEGDDFCGNCGAYLGWSRSAAAKAEAASASASSPPPPPAPDSASATSPGPAPGPAPAPAPGSAPAPAAPEPAPAEPGTSRTEATWRAVSRRVTRARKEEPPATPEAEAPRPALPEPVPAPEPPPTLEPAPGPRAAAPAPQADPVAVEPAKPLPARPVLRPVTADETPDGPPCPRCGTPNLPDRRFCRRCAAPLTPTAAAPELPWWRTRWPFRRRARIGGSGAALRRTVALLAVVALVVAAVLLYPAGRRAFEDVRDKLGSTAPISPSRTTASAAVEGHPATAADDGLTNTYWGAPAIGDAITFDFRTPYRLVDLIVHTGGTADPQHFQEQARPLVLALDVTSSDGSVHRQRVTLNDQPGPQTVATGISDVTRVKLTVQEAAGGAPGRPIALAEVEFFKRA